MKTENQHGGIKGKKMHGRKKVPASLPEPEEKARERVRLNFEVKDKLRADLLAAASAHKMSITDFARAAIHNAIYKRGFDRAAQKVIRKKVIRERQEFLDAGLFLLNRMLRENLLLPPKCTLVEHTNAVLASASIAEIRFLLFDLVRRVAHADTLLKDDISGESGRDHDMSPKGAAA